MERSGQAERPVLTWDDVVQLQQDGQLVIVLEGKVYSISDDFVHPGGLEVRAVEIH